MKNLTARCKPGDLFYIPAFAEDGESGFVIARYIELMSPNVGHIIEIFHKHYKELPKNIKDVDTSSRLLRPVMFDMYFKNIPRWKIIFSNPTYEKSQSNYENIAFAFYSYAWVGGKKVETSQEILKSMMDTTCWSTDQLIFLVNAYISGTFNANERYKDDRVPPSQQIDNPAAYRRAIDLAKFVDDEMAVSAIDLKRTANMRLK